MTALAAAEIPTELKGSRKLTKISEEETTLQEGEKHSSHMNSPRVEEQPEQSPGGRTAKRTKSASSNV